MNKGRNIMNEKKNMRNSRAPELLRRRDKLSAEGAKPRSHYGD